jgi:HlyD family secretion protein
VSAILTPEQKQRYAEMNAETQANRASGGGGSGRVWVVGDDGKPKSIEVRLGLTDGAMTEIVSGDVREGSEVITGVQTAGTKTGSGAPAGPRLF